MKILWLHFYYIWKLTYFSNQKWTSGLIFNFILVYLASHYIVWFQLVNLLLKPNKLHRPLSTAGVLTNSEFIWSHRLCEGRQSPSKRLGAGNWKEQLHLQQSQCLTAHSSSCLPQKPQGQRLSEAQLAQCRCSIKGTIIQNVEIRWIKVSLQVSYFTKLN